MSLLGVATLSFLALAGCGSNSNGAATSSPSTLSNSQGTLAPLPMASTTTTTTKPNHSFHPVRSWTWTAHNLNGYKYSSTLMAGNPVTAANMPLLPDFASLTSVTQSCGFNATTDALVPVEVTLTNATPSFTTDVEDDFYLPSDELDDQSAERLSVVASYASGVLCRTLQPFNYYEPSMWSENCSQLAPQASCTGYGYVVLKNYFSPNHPSGDPAVLQGAQLYVQQGSAIDSMEGSGTLFAQTKGATVIPLSGTIPHYK